MKSILCVAFVTLTSNFAYSVEPSIETISIVDMLINSADAVLELKKNGTTCLTDVEQSKIII